MGWTPALEVRDKIQVILNSFGVPYSVNRGCVTTAPIKREVARSILNVLASDGQIKQRTTARVSTNQDGISICVSSNGTDAVFDTFYTRQHYMKRYASG